MKPRINRKLQARRDLLSHFVSISEHNREAGQRFLRAAVVTFRLLAHFPEMGAHRPFPRRRLNDLRMWPISDFSNYLVFYQPIEGGIRVVRVLHAAQDYTRVFGGRAD